MALFLLAALHLYIGARLLPPLPQAWAWAGGVLLLGLLALLIAGLSSARRRHAGMLAWVSFSAIGYFSSLLVLTLLRDVVLVGVGLGAPASLAIFAARSALAVPALALLASAVGFANARRRPAVKRVQVPID